MLKLYSFIGATVGSYAGWALGAPVGFMTAFMVSFVGWESESMPADAWRGTMVRNR